MLVSLVSVSNKGTKQINCGAKRQVSYMYIIFRVRQFLHLKTDWFRSTTLKLGYCANYNVDDNYTVSVIYVLTVGNKDTTWLLLMLWLPLLLLLLLSLSSLPLLQLLLILLPPLLPILRQLLQLLPLLLLPYHQDDISHLAICLK